MRMHVRVGVPQLRIWTAPRKQICVHVNARTRSHARTLPPQAVLSLLAHGASPSARGLYGSTPLHVAVTAGRADVLDALLARPDVDPNALDNDDSTPLLWAASAGQAAAVASLLRRGVDPFARNKMGHAPLGVAGRGSEAAALLSAYIGAIDAVDLARRGDADMLRRVLRWGHGDANAREGALEWAHHAGDDEGGGRGTLLHVAAAAGHVAVVSLLIEFGANLDAVSRRGWEGGEGGVALGMRSNECLMVCGPLAEVHLPASPRVHPTRVSKAGV